MCKTSRRFMLVWNIQESGAEFITRDVLDSFLSWIQKLLPRLPGRKFKYRFTTCILKHSKSQWRWHASMGGFWWDKPSVPLVAFWLCKSKEKCCSQTADFTCIFFSLFQIILNWGRRIHYFWGFCVILSWFCKLFGSEKLLSPELVLHLAQKGGNLPA